MSATEPLFLTVELVLDVHEMMIRAYGGSAGIRERGLIESAVAQGENLYWYAKPDLFEIAASYAFHIAENQPFLDGNKRTGVTAGLAFLRMNGIDLSLINSNDVYEMMIQIAEKKLTKMGLALFLRERLSP